MNRDAGKILSLFLGFLVLSGCAPASPPPPLLGAPDAFGLGWIAIILIALVIYLPWKTNQDRDQKSSNNNLVDAVNEINDRLRKLERKVEDIGKGKKA